MCFCNKFPLLHCASLPYTSFSSPTAVPTGNKFPPTVAHSPSVPPNNTSSSTSLHELNRKINK